MHLADLQRQIDVAKRGDAAQALRYAGHLQESHQGFVLQWDRSIKQSPRRGPHSRQERLGMRLEKTAGPGVVLEPSGDQPVDGFLVDPHDLVDLDLLSWYINRCFAKAGNID